MTKRLTDKGVERLGIGAGIVWDSAATGLGIKVTPRGKRIWVAQLRYPGHKVQTKRTLGTHPALSLSEARAKARAWYDLVKQGIDPEDAEANKRRQVEQARKAEALKVATTFAAVAERYIEQHLGTQRRATAGAREIRGELVAEWGVRPIASITPADVKALIAQIKARAPYQAKNCFGHARTLFKWAVHHDLLEASPVASLEQRWVLVGAKIGPRQRVLSETEIAAFWRAAGRMQYPAGPCYHLLLLLGVRVNELAKARWSELHPELRRLIREAQRENRRRIDWATVDDGAKLWTIPRERFKSDAEHLVPLSDDACRLLEELPRFAGCDFLFTANGEAPVWLGNKFKRRLDQRMARTLRALARTRGDPGQAKVAPWVNHDLRRVVRTNLSALDVADHIAEMVLGHGRKGLQRVYDQHRYQPQIREALARWAARLSQIVALKTLSPTPANVVTLRQGTVR
jgi:integrase